MRDWPGEAGVFQDQHAPFGFLGGDQAAGFHHERAHDVVVVPVIRPGGGRWRAGDQSVQPLPQRSEALRGRAGRRTPDGRGRWVNCSWGISSWHPQVLVRYSEANGTEKPILSTPTHPRAGSVAAPLARWRPRYGVAVRPRCAVPVDDQDLHDGWDGQVGPDVGTGFGFVLGERITMRMTGSEPASTRGRRTVTPISGIR